MLQMSVNSARPAALYPAPGRSLAQLPEGEVGALDRLELPDDIAPRLTEPASFPVTSLSLPAALRAANPVCIAWMAQKLLFGEKRCRG